MSENNDGAIVAFFGALLLLAAIGLYSLFTWCSSCIQNGTADIAAARAAYKPSIPGETFDTHLADGELRTEILKLNADLRGAHKPELGLLDIGAMTARDVSRLRMAVRYGVNPNQLDGQMREEHYMNGKTPATRIVED